MDTRIERTWLGINHKVRHKYSLQWAEEFGFDLNDPGQETLVGFNHRTFPSDHRWADGAEDRSNHLTWRRSGLTTFDFKGVRMRGRAPEGVHRLVRKAMGFTVTLEVFVERAFINTRELVESGEAAGVGSVVYSSNCGRAVLSYRNLHVEAPGVPRSPRRRSVKHKEGGTHTPREEGGEGDADDEEES